MFAGLADRTWFWFAAGFYLLGLLLGTLLLLRGGRGSNATINVIIALGYIGQVIGLYTRGRATGGCPLGNTFEIFQFTAWSAITLYLIVGVRFRSSLLGYFSTCLASVLTLTSLAIPAWDATRRSKIFGGNPWVELHASLALFSYGVFALLALTAFMLLLRYLSLQRKRLGGWFSFLPPIVELDHISLRLLITGVAFMTIAVFGGTSYWLREHDPVHASKIVATVAVWLAYSITLVLRWRGHLLAKRFAWTCILLFFGALLSIGQVDASRRPPAPPAQISVPPR
ncbi:cytochrome C assembly family protein [Opitutus terrae]|uniref:Cytochrome c assembly protein n=1 Tax=Opitutus terrae (strain DSM 11246 / JCM 15787 / PB90-1) TaxID=452637 RepID=B1ZMU4_OPITP|nr:cytochrome c biogenesis protein CcsA [Opitutus terrae]ACB75372.1 cytochrome c assembly protein [Opitutus terrae PB90-1]